MLERRHVDAAETTVNLVLGVASLPVLLRGYPLTHGMRHRAVPLLAQRHTVVAVSLGGYGGSGQPPFTASHAPSSKPAMRGDRRRATAALGFDRCHLGDHDSGARNG